MTESATPLLDHAHSSGDIIIDREIEKGSLDYARMETLKLVSLLWVVTVLSTVAGKPTGPVFSWVGAEHSNSKSPLLQVNDGETATIRAAVDKLSVGSINATWTVQNVNASDDVMSGLKLTSDDQTPLHVFNSTSFSVQLDLRESKGVYSGLAHIDLSVDAIANAVIRNHTVQLLLELDMPEGVPVPEFLGPVLRITIMDSRRKW